LSGACLPGSLSQPLALLDPMKLDLYVSSTTSHEKKWILVLNEGHCIYYTLLKKKGEMMRDKIFLEYWGDIL
jgi:hypothetical protein